MSVLAPLWPPNNMSALILHTCCTPGKATAGQNTKSNYRGLKVNQNYQDKFKITNQNISFKKARKYKNQFTLLFGLPLQGELCTKQIQNFEAK